MLSWAIPSWCSRPAPIPNGVIDYFVNEDVEEFEITDQLKNDLKSVIENRRVDMIVTGYGEGKIYLKNDLIVLRHPLKFIDEKNESYNKTLIIK